MGLGVRVVDADDRHWADTTVDVRSLTGGNPADNMRCMDIKFWLVVVGVALVLGAAEAEPNKTGTASPLLWQTLTGGTVRSSPAIGADGTVYVGSHGIKVLALDGKTGFRKWEFKTAGTVWSSPAIGANGTIYVGSSDSRVYALDEKTGAKKWEFKTGEAVSSSPAIGADGTVYVGSNDHKVYALDGNTGA